MSFKDCILPTMFQLTVSKKWRQNTCKNYSNEHRTAVMFQVILRQPLVALTSAQPEENLWQQMEEQAVHLHYAFAVTQLTVSKHWRNSKKVLKK